MRVVSYNVNGLRAAIKKGLLDWMKTDSADIICFQEIKAQALDINTDQLKELGYHCYWFSAQKKGYSGVAIFAKSPATEVFYGQGEALSDFEGRVIRADFGDITVVNAYFPSGTSGEIRQDYKYIWLAGFEKYLSKLRKTRKKLIVVGDYNIAHQEIDIHDPKGNKKSSGFLPEEREWMSQFLAKDFTDTYRYLHPEKTGAYSWWSQRFPSVRLQNKGWRIDYICVSNELLPNLISANVLPEIKHSDHCPIDIQLRF